MRNKPSVVDKSEILHKIEYLISQTDISCSQDQLDKMATLVVLLEKWNKALNLTAIRDPMQMVVLHILDSAVVSPLIKNRGDNIADVGTGAGFPGLVLAILNPDKHFTLIDSIAKKLSFVRTAMVSLNLNNISIINDRCENIKLDKKFDCILSRAFAPLCKIIEWCKDLISDEGVFLAMKANLEHDELDQIDKNTTIEEIIELKVPSLAASLAAMQKKILVVDCDPQGNATMASGVLKFGLEKSITNVLVDGLDIKEAVVTTTEGGFHLIPSNEDLTAAEVSLLDKFGRESFLKKSLDKIKDNYDFVLIDCPPSLNILTVNALCAADSILVPLQCEYFALEGLTLLIETVDQLASAVNSKLKIEGILRTMFDNRNRLSTDVSDELKKNFGDLVYETIIPRNVRLAEAPSYGKPAMYYDKSSVGSKAYLSLAAEIISKANK